MVGEAPRLRFSGDPLGAVLPEDADLRAEFYKLREVSDIAVFDAFMGSGTTVGEAHKLGFTAIGRDINPVAVESVRTALGPMDRTGLEAAFEELSRSVGRRIRDLYRSTDSKGRTCDLLYCFWVMQVPCLECRQPVDLFPSRIIARNAYPSRKPEVQIVCPVCGDIFPGLQFQNMAACRSCSSEFDPQHGPAQGAKAYCGHCDRRFPILEAVDSAGRRPEFKFYGKLVLTRKGSKEYLPAAPGDQALYRDCSAKLQSALEGGEILLPALALENGYNTRQAMSYGFVKWRDFFNDRQLLALGWLHAAISTIPDASSRSALLTFVLGCS